MAPTMHTSCGDLKDKRTLPSFRTPNNIDVRGRVGHEYHAEANLLSGTLRRPIVQEIPEQAALSLRDWRGGHLYQRAQGYDLEGLISFKSGYTRVSGYRGLKTGNPFVTMATSVIEGLNVFDVLTADRVVVQISTEHPERVGDDFGHVPRVHFLGTQFVNLKIGGYRVNATLNPKICAARPANDVPYLFNPDFLKQADDLVKGVRDPKKVAAIPAGLKERSQEFLADYEREAQEIAYLEGLVRENKTDDREHKVVCSLINDLSFPDGAIPGVLVAQNVMYIPDFGILSLGRVEVGRNIEKLDGKDHMSNYFTVQMLEMRLGCVGDGRIVAGSGKGNGVGKP